MPESSKSLDEMYCRSCGEIIHKRVTYCPECGVKNEGVPGVAASGSSEPGFVDQIAPVASWGAVVFLFLLAVGTVTESVSGMPVRMAAGTVIYVLLGLFAAPPVRRKLAERSDVTFGRGPVVVILLVGTILNEGLVAPPLS